MLLKHGNMPEDIYIILLGEIQILGQTKEQNFDYEVVTIKTDPGSRTASLIQQGREYGQILATRTID